jgi:uncharacterized protein (DUF849 family)
MAASPMTMNHERHHHRSAAAVTGAGDTVGKHPASECRSRRRRSPPPRSRPPRLAPRWSHCHVRDPKTGKGSRDVALYREVMERIRASGVDVIVNLTAGMGGDLEIGPGENPMPPSAPAPTWSARWTRLVHVEALLPDICTLDCGTLNFGDGDTDLRLHAGGAARRRQAHHRTRRQGRTRDLRHRPSVVFQADDCKEGLLKDPLFQLCLGIPWGAPADTTTMKAMVDNLPAGATWAGFGIGRMQMPMAAQAMLLGGMCASGWRTTCGWTRACLPATARWSSACQADRVHGRAPDDAGRRPRQDGLN